VEIRSAFQGREANQNGWYVDVLEQNSRHESLDYLSRFEQEKIMAQAALTLGAAT